MTEQILGKEAIYQDDLTTSDRLKSMLLDHAIICFTILPIFMIPTAIGITTEFKWFGEIGILLIMTIYLNKDFLNGRSVAKRILGQVVINTKTGKPANEVKCAFRNFMIPLWIIEVIVVIFTSNKRIGDFMAGTKVVRTKKKEIKSMLADLKNANKAKWVLSFGIAILYAWIITHMMSKFLP